MSRAIKIAVAFFCLSVCLSAGSFSSTRQSTIDSLKQLISQRSGEEKIQLLNRLSKQFWQTAPDSSLKYANQALEYARQANHQPGISDAFNRVGNAYYILGDTSKALESYNRSLKIRKELNDPDRLFQIYNNLGVYYSNHSQTDKALNNYHKAYQVSKEANLTENTAQSLSALASHYQQNNNYEKAIENYLKSIEEFQSIDDTLQMAETYINLGRIYRNISSYDKALKYYLKAIRFLKQGDDELSLANAYNETGIIHLTMEDYDKALEYYEKALHLLEKLERTDQVAMVYNNIGIIYDDQGDNEQALEYYKKSLETDQDANDMNGMASSLNNIGLIYFEQKEYTEALDYLNRSLEYARELHDKHKIANTHNNIGEVLIETGDYPKAHQAISTGLELAKEVRAKQYKNESYELFSKLYEAQGDHKNALKYFKRHHNLKDTIYSQEKQNRISEIQIKYETERKEKEIELLKKDNQINKLEIKRHKNFRNYATIFAILVLALAILVFSRFNLKKKHAKILERKNKQLSEANMKLRDSENNLRELNATKDKFFSIIAHDLKNPFHALFGFSEEMYKNIHHLNKNEIRDYGKAIFEASQNLYNLLQNLLKWSRAQLGSIQLKPQQLPLHPTTEEIISLLKINAEEKNIRIKNDIPPHMKAYVDQNVFDTVMRNLLSNAIKFTDSGGNVRITAKKENGQTYVSLKDTGRGIPHTHLKNLFSVNNNLSTHGTSNEQGTGLGLILCKELIEKSNGEIWADSTPGEGSTFSFSLPVQSN